MSMCHHGRVNVFDFDSHGEAGHPDNGLNMSIVYSTTAERVVRSPCCISVVRFPEHRSGVSVHEQEMYCREHTSNSVSVTSDQLSVYNPFAVVRLVDRDISELRTWPHTKQQYLGH